MPVSRDLALLRKGQPPSDESWLEDMTVGREAWLDLVREHYLGNYIREGGSKVKVLVGTEGSGKTHLLYCVGADARKLDYLTVWLSARDLSWKLSDVVSLYKAVAAQVDREELLRGICRRVAEKLGYDADRYDGSGSILPLLVEQQGLPRNIVWQRILKAAVEAFRDCDLSPPFYTLAYTLVTNRMESEQPVVLEACWKWLLGEKLEPAEKRAARLYDRLMKSSARVWLYSLIRLLRLSGKAGIVVLLDQLEAITERDPETGRFRYTPNAATDVFELIRQLIDDVELLQHFLLVLSGRPEVVEDDRRGIKCYDALWMRLQSGLVATPHFNPWADMLDVDAHLAAADGDGFVESVGKGLQEALRSRGIERRYQDVLLPTTTSCLRERVMEVALMTEAEDA